MAERTAEDMRRREIREKLDLLCLAAELVLENGGETYRVEETAKRMASGLGLGDVNVVAFPTSMFVEASGCARVCRISRRGNDLVRLAQVNDVSRRVERGQMEQESIRRALEEIAQIPGPSQLTRIIASGLAGASFSLLFGGDVGTFIVAFIIGMLVQAIQPLFSGMEMGMLFGNFFGGALTALLAEGIAFVLPYGSVNATIIGGIMPLLSGLLVTNAVRDTVYGDLISGVTRAVEALLLAVFVALGVFVGLKCITMTGGLL